MLRMEPNELDTQPPGNGEQWHRTSGYSRNGGTACNWAPPGGYLAIIGTKSDFASAEAVRLLLEAGAQPNKVDEKTGVFPLLMAAQNDHAEAVRLLLEAGAKPNMVYEKSGVFPLLLAAQQGHAEAVSLLLEAGARAWAAPVAGVIVGLIGAGAVRPNLTGAKAAVSAATKGQGSNIQAAADFGILVWRERAIGGQIVGRIPSTIERADSASGCAGFRSKTTLFNVPVKAYGALSS